MRRHASCGREWWDQWTETATRRAVLRQVQQHVQHAVRHRLHHPARATRGARSRDTPRPSTCGASSGCSCSAPFTCACSGPATCCTSTRCSVWCCWRCAAHRSKVLWTLFALCLLVPCGHGHIPLLDLHARRPRVHRRGAEGLGSEQQRRLRARLLPRGGARARPRDLRFSTPSRSCCAACWLLQPGPGAP